MDELIAEVLRLDDRRQAVFRVALAEQVQPILASSKHYQYAVRARDLCWRWIVHGDVNGDTFLALWWNDDDFGVGPAMDVAFGHDHDTSMGNAWGCVAGALTYIGYCAFQADDLPIPQDFNYDDYPDEILSENLGYYHGVVGSSGVPELLVEWLRDLSHDQLTQSVVDAKLDDLASPLE